MTSCSWRYILISREVLELGSCWRWEMVQILLCGSKNWFISYSLFFNFGSLLLCSLWLSSSVLIQLHTISSCPPIFRPKEVELILVYPFLALRRPFSMSLWDLWFVMFMLLLGIVHDWMKLLPLLPYNCESYIGYFLGS